jgi:predicted amidohydrolase
MTTLTIGTIAVAAARCDKEANFATIDRLTSRCAEQGAELVVMPEGFLEGYVVKEPGMNRERFLALAEPLDGPYVDRLKALAHKRGVWLLACFAERQGALAFNSALLITREGGGAGIYRKTHIQSGGDPHYYAPGEDLPVFQTPWGPTGVMICYDRQFPEVPRALMRQGARLILNPAWGQFGEMNEAMMRTRARENGIFIAFVHVKGTLVIDPEGTVLARTGPRDETLVHKIDLDHVDRLRREGSYPFRDHRRQDLYARAVAKLTQ